MKKKRVLIVDDFKPLLEDISEFLTMEGFIVRTAANGAEGLQQVVQESPDIIICDIEMPHINGLDMFKTLSQIPDKSNIPFIFLTARATTDDFRAALKIGADDYITKPFDLDELLTSVKLRLQKAESRNIVMEQKFLALFNAPHYATFLYNDNKFVLVNECFTEVTGYKPNTLNQIKIADVLQTNKDKLLNECSRCFKKLSEKFETEFSFVNAKKELVFAKLFAARVSIGGEPAMVGSFIPFTPDTQSANNSHSELDEIIEYFKANNENIANEIHNVRNALSFSDSQKHNTVIEQVALTKRETEILGLICEGLTNKEICEKLFISIRTVEKHRASILEKTKVSNTAALVAFAIQNKMV